MFEPQLSDSYHKHGPVEQRGCDFHQCSFQFCSQFPYPIWHSLWAICFSFDAEKRRSGGYSEPLIEKTRATAPQILQKAGYQTAIVGKWHLGLEWGLSKTLKPALDSNNKVVPGSNVDYSLPLTDTPIDHGFDYSYIIPASLDMNPYVYIENRKVENPNMKMMAGSNSPRGVFWRKGLASADFDITKTLDHFSDKAINYIEKYKSPKPFSLYITPFSPYSMVAGC